MNDTDLDSRLAALVARAPGRDDPPVLAGGHRTGRLAIPVMVAPLLVMAMVAAVAGGAVVVNQLARSYPGIENPGQPLEGAALECMSPPEAAAYLAARGYGNVVWQVESGSVAGSKGASSSVQQATPPVHGFVIPTAVLDDGKLHIVVDQRRGASGSGACFGMPMP